jgi:hypothetical protein
MTRLRVAERVGVTTEAGVVFAARLPDGPILALDGTAGLIWQRALDGLRENVAERVSDDTGIDVASIRNQVDRFVEELIELGLLVPVDRR